MIAILLAAGLVGAGPPASEGDAYLAVGRSELRAGRWETARLALRRAVRHLPRSADAAAGLGVALARLGRLGQAEAALDRAHHLGLRTPALLLELGMVRVRLGRYAEAGPLLAACIRRAKERPLREMARFYSALAALRRGDRRRAREGLRQVRAPALLEPARALLELAREPPRVSLHLGLLGAYDSNALLLPGTPSQLALPAPEGDGAFALQGGLRARPIPGVDLSLHSGVLYREQRTIDELDLVGVVSGLDYRLQLGRQRLSAGYGFDYLRLGGAPYLQTHRVHAGYLLRVSEALRLSADLQLSVRRFEAEVYRPFDGEGILTRVTAWLWGAPAKMGLQVGYEPSLELTRESDLAFHGHRFFAVFRWRPHQRWQITVGAALALRFYLGPDDVLGETRRETVPQAWLEVSFRLLRPWRLVLASSYERNAASPSFYEYERMQVSLASVVSLDLL